MGPRCKNYVVLASVNKENSELSSDQKKIFKVDDHIGVAIAGLTADGRVLSRYMRTGCINYSYAYESPLPVGRLVVQVADKAKACNGISSIYPTRAMMAPKDEISLLFNVRSKEN